MLVNYREYIKFVNHESRHGRFAKCGISNSIFPGISLDVVALTTESLNLRHMMKDYDLSTRRKSQAPPPVNEVEQVCNCGGSLPVNGYYQGRLKGFTTRSVENQNPVSVPRTSRRSISDLDGMAKDVKVKVGVSSFQRLRGVDFEPELEYSNIGEVFFLRQSDCFDRVVRCGNPTPGYDPIVSNSSPTLTPFGDSDFLLLEEADAFSCLAERSTSRTLMNPIMT
ncbi:hypothetical protein Tco_0878062 [Tanacetum coccineum]|uniref:Uncharacterized protein n=1 Tax=Tanacetum coccineum TaxID=301880 RepID=A0ABQ5BWX6_9ASTR